MHKRRLSLSFLSIFLFLSLSLSFWGEHSLAMENEGDEKDKATSVKMTTVSEKTRERTDTEAYVYSPSSVPRKQTHPPVLRETKHDAESKEGEFFIKHIHLLSSTLKIVDVSLLMEEPKVEEETKGPRLAAESAQFTTSKLDEPGDIRNGIFLVLESKKRPYRYYAKFFSFDMSKYKDEDEASFLLEDKNNKNNVKLTKLLKTPRKISLDMRTTLVTKTRPNKLILQIEEKDKRYFSGTQDFFGRLHSKFEDDPFAMICLLAGGVSRIAKAVMTSGSSEIDNFVK